MKSNARCSSRRTRKIINGYLGWYFGVFGVFICDKSAKAADGVAVFENADLLNSGIVLP
jgi:hypothetical protein